MKIEVRLFATLAAYLPHREGGPSVWLEPGEGSSVKDVVGALPIPDGTPFVTLLNGRDAAPEQPLADGDVLSLFPPLAGGR